MTEKERIEFFEKVKGKKIIAIGAEFEEYWEYSYFIPRRICNTDPSRMEGELWIKDKLDSIYDKRMMLNGFKKSDYGIKWGYYDKSEQVKDSPKEPHKCHCPKNVWMNLGCQCGGI